MLPLRDLVLKQRRPPIADTWITIVIRPKPKRRCNRNTTTFTLAGFQNKTTVCDQAWQAWTTKTRCCSVSLRYPRGRGAQTPGTATDTGTAGKQKDIKTETRAPADRGLRSKHGVEAGAQTGMDTETLCAAGEGDSTRILRRNGGASTMNTKKIGAPPRKTPLLIVCQRATVLRCLQPPQHC